MSLENYYEKYTDVGYICSFCGARVSIETYHVCSGSGISPIPYWIPFTLYPIVLENKTEKGFRILKVLVEKKIIAEPSTFKDFCDLIEKIAGVI